MNYSKFYKINFRSSCFNIEQKWIKTSENSIDSWLNVLKTLKRACNSTINKKKAEQHLLKPIIIIKSIAHQ